LAIIHFKNIVQYTLNGLTSKVNDEYITITHNREYKNAEW